MTKAFIDYIVHRAWGHAVQIVERVEISSNTLEIGRADDGVSPCPPGVACGSANKEGALTIAISPGYVVVLFKEITRVL